MPNDDNDAAAVTTATATATASSYHPLRRIHQVSKEIAIFTPPNTKSYANNGLGDTIVLMALILFDHNDEVQVTHQSFLRHAVPSRYANPSDLNSLPQRYVTTPRPATRRQTQTLHRHLPH